MPNEPEGRRDNEVQEDEGGPVKSFLEHLEDLRWVLIKSLVALGIAFVVCLIGGHYVVAILTYPLEKAEIQYPEDSQIVTMEVGTNRLTLFQLNREQQKTFQLPTNRFVRLQLGPVAVGTNTFFAFVARPDPEPSAAQKLSIPLVSFGPAGAFIVAVQVAAYAGAVLASPFILFFVAQFVFPALKLAEKKYVHRGMFYGFGLFMLGVGFCYFILMRIALAASVKYTHWLGLGVFQWRAEEYISFVTKFMLGMGLGFELPVIVLVLVKIGVLNYRTLVNARRYVVVICFILGAVLTTPEVITQVLMAVPLLILYEITIKIAWYWEQPDRAKARWQMLWWILKIVMVCAAAWAALQYGWPWVRELWTARGGS